MKYISPTLAMLVILGSTAAFGACPPAASGATAEIIRANEGRLLCLNQELAAETSRRKLDLDMTALERSVRDLQLQQRLDGLPAPVPPVFQLP